MIKTCCVDCKSTTLYVALQDPLSGVKSTQNVTMDKMQILYKKARNVAVYTSIKDGNDEDDFLSKNIDIKSKHEATENSIKTTRNYFKDVVENDLTDVLIECVMVRPDDPIEFVADLLEKYLAFKVQHKKLFFT